MVGDIRKWWQRVGKMNLIGNGQKIVVRNVEYEGGLLHIYFLQREQTGYAGSSQIACEIIQSCWAIRGVLVLKSMGYRVENGWFDVAKPGVDGPGVDAFRNIGSVSSLSNPPCRWDCSYWVSMGRTTWALSTEGRKNVRTGTIPLSPMNKECLFSWAWQKIVLLRSVCCILSFQGCRERYYFW